MIKINAVGDIVPGGVLTNRKDDYISADLLSYLKDADICVGTLECAIGNEPSFYSEKLKHSSAFVYAKDSDFSRLLEIGLNVVSLANNHFYDLGEDGAKHTIELLEKNGILHCGAGSNLEEARKPAVVDVKGKKIAFLGFCDCIYDHVKWCKYADDLSPGVNPMTKANVVDSIVKAKKNFDYVVVMAHWGKEHKWIPRPEVKNMALIMQKAGASLILGDHPHRVQPCGFIRKCPIVYSLGNFLFPDRVINTPYVTYYPDNPNEFLSLPTIMSFSRVECPTLKIWPDISRVGMVLSVYFDEGRCTRLDCKLTRLSKNNVISFLNNDRFVKKKLKQIFFLMNCGFCFKMYFILSKFMNKMRTIKDRLKKR